MKVNKLKLLSRAICCLVAALLSEAQCMERIQEIDQPTQMSLFNKINQLEKQLKDLKDQQQMYSVENINFCLSFPLSVESEVNDSISFYKDISNWVWHAKTSGKSVCDHVPMTFRCLDKMESYLKLLILEKLNSGAFSDALSVSRIFDRLSQNIGSSYTWGDTRNHVRSILPKLEKYTFEQSLNFFNTFLKDQQFSKAISIANSYQSVDGTVSNKWLAIVEKKQLMSAID